MQYPTMMLWILVLSGLSAVGSADELYFSSLVAELSSGIGVRGADQIAAVLEEFLWTALYLRSAADGFWKQVEDGK